MTESKTCINCGSELECRGTARFCLSCNSQEIDQAQVFLRELPGEDHVFIECPGASLYAPGTNDVVEGVEYYDRDDPGNGHRIIKNPVFAPDHHHRRRIMREALGKITRCRACQDYTVRMRRKEGVDFFIPSSRHPGRKKLKSVEHTTWEP
jgi:hypothetical protein